MRGNLCSVFGQAAVRRFSPFRVISASPFVASLPPALRLLRSFGLLSKSNFIIRRSHVFRSDIARRRFRNPRNDQRETVRKATDELGLAVAALFRTA